MAYYEALASFEDWQKRNNMQSRVSSVESDDSPEAFIRAAMDEQYSTPPSLFKKSANAVKETIASQHDEYKNSTYKIPPNESNIGLIDVHPGISKKHITKKE